MMECAKREMKRAIRGDFEGGMGWRGRGRREQGTRCGCEWGRQSEQEKRVKWRTQKRDGVR